MLNEIPYLRVFSEPLALNFILSSPKAPTEELLISRFRKVATLLDLATPSQFRGLVVKWGSWSILCWKLIESALHPRSTIFLWRDSIEVAVSLLAEKPQWLEKTELEAIFERYAADFKPRNTGADAESVSRILAAMMTAANSMPASTLKVNYTMLPMGVIDVICTSMNWEIDDSIAARMMEVSKYDAKSNKKIVFKDDSKSKQMHAPNDVKYFVKKICERGNKKRLGTNSGMNL